jgi:hypothetical protein
MTDNVPKEIVFRIPEAYSKIDQKLESIEREIGSITESLIDERDEKVIRALMAKRRKLEDEKLYLRRARKLHFVKIEGISELRDEMLKAAGVPNDRSSTKNN